jgi:hypothetical protein
MGLCGCKLAANEQDIDAIPVTTSSARMGALLAEMQIASTDVTVTFLRDLQAPPYSVDDVDYNSSQDVDVAGGYRGRFTGINQISAIGNNSFLVSDSFSPCVPVIIFSPTNVWLLHANGTVKVSEIKKVASGHDVDIYIIRKGSSRSAQVATAIFDELHEYSAQMVDIDTNEMVGVVVSAASKTILVYCQGS